jgi:signal transduction histidine kinase
MATRDRHAAAVAAESRRRFAEREASLRERAAIARELHDIVAHHVASIALRSAVARDVLPGLDPAVRRVLDEIHGAATLTLTEMRRLVALLRVLAGSDDAADATLASRVEMLDPAELLPEVRLLLDRVAEIGPGIDLQVDGDVSRLDAGQAITVLRVVQESVTNVLRHAGANATAVVHISVSDREVRVEIRDTGVGAGADSGRGFGLVGLGERLELLGGTLIAGPADLGWRVVATFARHRGDALRRPDSPPGPGRLRRAAAVEMSAIDSPASAAGQANR